MSGYFQRQAEDAEREYEENAALRARAEKAEAERDAAIGALMDVVEQVCWWCNVYDSRSIGAYTDALRFLAKAGRMRITHDQGRRVIAERVEQPVASQTRSTNGVATHGGAEVRRNTRPQPGGEG